MTRPLSVVLGRDRDVIPTLINIHAPTADPDILDCTHNRGVMWKGLKYRVTSLDVDPQFGTDYVGDFRDMHMIPDASYDVIAFDPPHLVGDAGADVHLGSTRYGLDKVEVGGYSISPLFAPFLAEARRILRPNGIVLAKLIDQVHNHRYQWQHVDFINACRDAAMTPCDTIIKVDPSAGTLNDPRWKHVRHVRRAHTFWIVVRNSKRCEAKDRP